MFNCVANSIVIYFMDVLQYYVIIIATTSHVNDSYTFNCSEFSTKLLSNIVLAPCSFSALCCVDLYNNQQVNVGCHLTFESLSLQAIPQRGHPVIDNMELLSGVTLC